MVLFLESSDDQINEHAHANEKKSLVAFFLFSSIVLLAIYIHIWGGIDDGW